MSTDILLPLLFFFIAVTYSSVGFGGGSSYLAVLSLFLTSFHEIRTTALILNLTVVSIGTVMFIRHRVFNWKEFWPFLILSIPMAFLGASVKLTETVFFITLGVLLILSGIWLILKHLFPRPEKRSLKLFTRIGTGGGVGFLSGLSGIGGGIYLSPLLNLLNWKDARLIASLSSIFILVNSLSGLTGLMVSGYFEVNLPLLWKLMISVGLGSIIGTYYSTSKLNSKGIGLLTAFLVLYVGLRLLLLYGFGLQI